MDDIFLLMSKSHVPQAEDLVDKQVPETTFKPEQD